MLESKQGLWNFSSKIMIKGSLVSLSEANGWWQTCYFPSMHRAAGIKYIKYYVRPIWMQSSHQSGERGNKDWTADRYLVHTRYLKSPLIKNNLMNRNRDVVGIGIQLGRNCKDQCSRDPCTRATLWFAVVLHATLPRRGNGFIDCSLLMTIIQW